MRYALVLIPLSLFLLASTPANARRFDEQTYVLALTCVGEATFHLPDCAPIAEVLVHRSRSRNIVKMAKGYSALFKPHPSTRKTWILALPNGFEKPDDWPEHIQPWVFVRDRWRMTLLHAHRIRSSMVPHQCTERPWHWGAANGVDLARANAHIKAGRWKKIECPGAQNLFYAKGPRYATRSLRPKESSAHGSQTSISELHSGGSRVPHARHASRDR